MSTVEIRVGADVSGLFHCARKIAKNVEFYSFSDWLGLGCALDDTQNFQCIEFISYICKKKVTANMSAHKQIPKQIRQQVYEKYGGHCAYCGRKLTLKEMQVDHVYSVYHAELNQKGKVVDADDIKGDPECLKEKASHVNDIDNLMPACRQCNFYKGAMDIEAFRNHLETTLFYNATNTFQFRLAERYGLVQATPHHISFYFENEKKNQLLK